MSKFACRIVGLASIAFCAVAVAQGGAEECRKEWDKSSAAHSCYPTSVSFHKESDRCRITLNCTGPRYSTYTESHKEIEHYKMVDNNDWWFLADVSKLANCDGVLKAGSCSRQGTGATSAPPPPPPPPNECEVAWSQSTASKTCSGDVSLENGKCRVKAACNLPPPGGGKDYNSDTWSAQDVAKLANCHGILKLGSCN